MTNPLAGGLPSINISGFGLGGTPVLGTAFNRPQYFTPNPYYDFQDSVSILKGKHTIKIGGEYAHGSRCPGLQQRPGRFNFLGGQLLAGLQLARGLLRRGYLADTLLTGNRYQVDCR